MLFEYLPILIFLILALAFAVVMLSAGFFLAEVILMMKKILPMSVASNLLKIVE